MTTIKVGPKNASQIPFTPAGNVAATTVQAAIEELDTTIGVVMPGNAAAVVTIPDSAGPTFNAQSGLTQIARLTATGNRAIAAPTNPVDGQRVIIEHTASGADRTMSLATGSNGQFRYGTDITALTATTSGKTDRIGVIYNASAQRWDVIAYAKGF